MSKSAVGRLARGEISPSKGLGKPTTFHHNVEAELAKVCLYLKDANMAIERCLMQPIALEIASGLGMPEGSFRASDSWLRGFLGRHPELAVRPATSESFIQVQAAAMQAKVAVAAAKTARVAQREATRASKAALKAAAAAAKVARQEEKAECDARKAAHLAARGAMDARPSASDVGTKRGRSSALGPPAPQPNTYARQYKKRRGTD